MIALAVGLVCVLHLTNTGRRVRRVRVEGEEEEGRRRVRRRVKREGEGGG